MPRSPHSPHARMHSIEPYNSDGDQHSTHSDHGRKRSSRACDQCRKTKSKCDPSDVDGFPCRSCAASGIECLYLGPSFKRGPPKGYIHALERRLHEVEALLGTIIGSSDPRARSLISELTKDPLAESIVHRVTLGPFGAVGCHNNSISRDQSCGTVLGGSDTDLSESSRLARQSRQLREQLSMEEGNVVLPRPTSQWQCDLLRRLSSSADWVPGATHEEPSSPRDVFLDAKKHQWEGMYTFDDAEDTPSLTSDEDRKADERAAVGAIRALEEEEVLRSRMIASMLGIDVHAHMGGASMPLVDSNLSNARPHQSIASVSSFKYTSQHAGSPVMDPQNASSMAQRGWALAWPAA